MRRQDLPGQEIAKEYCGTEATTVTLASKYGTSPSVILRVLQDQIDYDRLKRISKLKLSAGIKRGWHKRWANNVKPSFTTEDVLFAYTKTPATAKSIAAKYGVPTVTIGRILSANLDPDTFEKLKAKKNSRGHIRSNLARYRLEHGL